MLCLLKNYRVIYSDYKNLSFDGGSLYKKLPLYVRGVVEFLLYGTAFRTVFNLALLLGC